LHFQERLKIAKEFGDRSAERRAHSNLGNAHIFLGEFEKAAEHYKQTLLLAQVSTNTTYQQTQLFAHRDSLTKILLYAFINIVG
jgi:G-protein signaling modulator 2